MPDAFEEFPVVFLKPLPKGICYYIGILDSPGRAGIYKEGNIDDPPKLSPTVPFPAKGRDEFLQPCLSRRLVENDETPLRYVATALAAEELIEPAAQLFEGVFDRITGRYRSLVDHDPEQRPATLECCLGGNERITQNGSPNLAVAKRTPTLRSWKDLISMQLQRLGFGQTGALDNRIECPFEMLDMTFEKCNATKHEMALRMVAHGTGIIDIEKIHVRRRRPSGNPSR